MSDYLTSMFMAMLVIFLLRRMCLKLVEVFLRKKKIKMKGGDAVLQSSSHQPD